ncbi:hypothetical protein [Celeribacter sp. SCSIO 80788]|uniref:hypothetical protein n=1 Tax=Celeribacter sp. SCSIO 80788 TaxID=3117013 RepID=UPI003DA5E54E
MRFGSIRPLPLILRLTEIDAPLERRHPALSRLSSTEAERLSYEKLSFGSLRAANWMSFVLDGHITPQARLRLRWTSWGVFQIRLTLILLSAGVILILFSLMKPEIGWVKLSAALSLALGIGCFLSLSLRYALARAYLHRTLRTVARQQKTPPEGEV